MNGVMLRQRGEEGAQTRPRLEGVFVPFKVDDPTLSLIPHVQPKLYIKISKKLFIPQYSLNDTLKFQNSKALS